MQNATLEKGLGKDLEFKANDIFYQPCQPGLKRL